MGSYTRDGKVVIAHNNWTEYKEGSRWNIIFDIVPSEGYRILMDGMPGLIHSGDDIGVNSAGLAITETTIGHFSGFDPKGIPEFERARKAMQYAANIDDYARIMEDGNNGGYANTWLLADTRNNEIASLELGLKHVTLRRTHDGYFVGSNFPENPELIRDEASDYPGERYEYQRERAARALGASLCRRTRAKSTSRRPSGSWPTTTTRSRTRLRPANGPCAATSIFQRADPVRGSRRMGPPARCRTRPPTPPCSRRCRSPRPWVTPMESISRPPQHLKEHPEFAWEKSVLRDLDSHPWTTFRSAQ